MPAERRPGMDHPHYPWSPLPGREARRWPDGCTLAVCVVVSLEQATLLSTTPVINYPNVATLWVSRIRERPRVRDGAVEAGPMMSATLAFDHRFLHGADATRFINTLAELLEGSA